tara:strand:- start:217 stop:684 length:468 start_codon:yes stop_codon:yes gene_type:complete
MNNGTAARVAGSSLRPCCNGPHREVTLKHREKLQREAVEMLAEHSAIDSNCWGHTALICVSKGALSSEAKRELLRRTTATGTGTGRASAAPVRRLSGDAEELAQDVGVRTEQACGACEHLRPCRKLRVAEDAVVSERRSLGLTTQPPGEDLRGSR